MGEASGDSATFSLAGAGDVDGDGLDDLLIGAPFNDDGGNDAGKAYLFLGASLGTSATVDLSTADYSFIGEANDDAAGRGVGRAGDVDGDGLDDILFGATGNDDGGSSAGKGYLVLGASLGTSTTIDLSAADNQLIGKKTYDAVGAEVTSAGDVDGDGLDDILLGANYSSEGGADSGAVFLVLGASLGATSTIDLSDADYTFAGESSSDMAGYSVSSGDMDGDGLGDILVGAYRNDDGGSYAGKTYLVLGASLGSSASIDLSFADHSFVGENSKDYAGLSVAGNGDFDGDGLDDLVIGAYGNDDAGTEAGKAYLLLTPNCE